VSQQSVNLKWYNVDSLAFTLNTPALILATADKQKFFLTFLNYNASALSSNLSVTWSIVPNLTSSTYQSLAQSNTNMTIAKGGFTLNTAYTIRATVTNT
jgi:hypothetical protein